MFLKTSVICVPLRKQTVAQSARVEMSEICRIIIRRRHNCHIPAEAYIVPWNTLMHCLITIIFLVILTVAHTSSPMA